MSAPLDIPAEIRQRLFAEAANRCRLCQSDESRELDVVLIVPHGRIGGYREEHLIVLCEACRADFDNGVVQPEELYRAKQLAPILRFPGSYTPPPKEETEDEEAERIADDPLRLAYLRYLARLYNTYKTEDLGHGKVRYGTVYRSYKEKLGCSLEDTPVTRFEEGVRYLQRRIKLTRTARALRDDDEAPFASFLEFNPDDYRAL